MINHRRRILEFGSGISTVFLAAMVAQMGGLIISVDHQAAWQAQVREWLSVRSREAIRFVCAPLQTDSGEGWYDRSLVDRALEDFGPVDLVLFDGPPAHEECRKYSRRPGLPAVRKHIGATATVALDDIGREGERQIALEWSQLLGTPCLNLSVKAGLALWHLGPSWNPV
ncbi:MAG TPA: class I SAM-dependent methyltransferase [Opitutaceae bacterium]